MIAMSVTALLVTGCSSSSAPPGSDQDSSNPRGATSSATGSPTTAAEEPTALPSQQTGDMAPSGVMVNVTVRGNKVRPFAKACAGAARPGDRLRGRCRPRRGRHIHSSTEQSADFTKGKSNISVRIDKPGVVEVE